MDFLKRLINALFAALLFPTIHFGYVFALSIHQKESLSHILTRFFIETLVIVLWSLSLINGRFPTSVDLSAMTSLEIVLLLGFTVGLWLYFGLLIKGLAGIFRPLISNHLRRWQKFAVAFTFATVLLIWMLLPRLPSPDHATIHINLTETIGPMPTLQRGFSQGGEIQMRDQGYFETAMSQLSDLRPTFIRIDHLYDYYDVFSIPADGSPHYDWTELDRIVDAIIGAGAEPFMSISYTPPALSNGDMSDPPTDLAAWEEQV